VSAVADYRVDAKLSKTGGIVTAVPMIDSVLVTGDGKSGFWNVHLNQWQEIIATDWWLRYSQPRTAPEDGVVFWAEMPTGEALLQETAVPTDTGVGFYTSVAGFLSLHQELLPRVKAVTREQSRRLTEVLFRNKLVRRLA
jgi:hypothetical protein